MMYRSAAVPRRNRRVRRPSPPGHRGARHGEVGGARSSACLDNVAISRSGRLYGNDPLPQAFGHRFDDHRSSMPNDRPPRRARRSRWPSSCGFWRRLGRTSPRQQRRTPSPHRRSAGGLRRSSSARRPSRTGIHGHGRRVVHRVEPAALPPGSRDDVTKCRPEPESPVTGREKRGAHSAASDALAAESPTAGRLAIPFGQRDRHLRRSAPANNLHRRRDSRRPRVNADTDSGLPADMASPHRTDRARKAAVVPPAGRWISTAGGP